MLSLRFSCDSSPRLLCLGAHSDDIEIGAGATLLTLGEQYPDASVTWVVFSAAGDRENEARASAYDFTAGFRNADVHCFDMRDGYFPMLATDIKDIFEKIKSSCSPDIVLTHYRDDRHQDHRTVSELTWQTFRNHLVLEYEIPKYDGDLGTPNLYQPVTKTMRDRKLDALEEHFGSQRSKAWFSRDTFAALMRLRGIECNADDGYAEAFHCRKASF